MLSVRLATGGSSFIHVEVTLTTPNEAMVSFLEYLREPIGTLVDCVMARDSDESKQLSKADLLKKGEFVQLFSWSTLLFQEAYGDLLMLEENAKRLQRAEVELVELEMILKVNRITLDRGAGRATQHD
ncbi:hypothetical protein Pint_33001 [Pistacia integerrima]|uniref:Uncharacterized protein n=1 Tax=Pistacia integerrima TaxID=434235 RepID=A0ACC0X541_9ROSI|nr:hypothetical protein Pint_33001 [Pistacia integerrima]